jgi:hypothetical protein
LIILLLLPAIFVCTGFLSLMGRPIFFDGYPHDLYLRWIEEACVRAGESPIDVGAGRLPPPAAGVSTEADYPPWALVLGLAFTLPGWRATCYLFAVWDLAALALIALWAYGVGSARSKAAGFILALGVLAIGVNRTVLNFGQYTLVSCGLLALSLIFTKRRNDWLAGLALGISLLKFSISLPFCICFLVTGRWKTLAAAGGVIFVSALASWPLIHVPPWILFQQAEAIGATMVTRTPTLPKALVRLGLSPSHAVAFSAAVVGGAGSTLIWFHRRDSMLTLFAIAAVTGRLWTMHYYYDDSMILFVLVALGARAIAPEPSKCRKIHLAAFLIVGLSLWLTFGDILRWPGVTLQYIVWLLGLYCLLAGAQKNTSRTTDFSGYRTVFSA